VDPDHNVQIWRDADMFSIQPWKGKFIATAGATSDTCLRPSDPVPGCFHTFIAVSPQPLAVDGFKELTGLLDQLPANQGNYVRLVINGKGDASIIGFFGPPHTPNERNIPPGVAEVPITLP